MKNTTKQNILLPRILNLDVWRIAVNPNQPRRIFDEASLRELAESIRLHGILQPLSVRRENGGYILVAGERRLRAAIRVGLREVPCIVTDIDAKDSALLALVENLQRKDLSWAEEAQAIARLMHAFGLSQEQAAAQLGKSQSAIANKLRLLQLSKNCRALLMQANLSERHARALLRLTDEEMRLAALREMICRHLTVAQSEQLVERMLQSRQTEKKPKSTLILKDVRLLLNSLKRQVNSVREAGIPAEMKREDKEGEIFLTIRIPTEVKEAKDARSESFLAKN